MTRSSAGARSVLAVWLIVAAIGCSPSAPVPPSAGVRSPDVIVISIETLRADHTSAYGYERDTTPNLARLARQGTRFELAYAPTSTTAPTHATLFTGLYPVSHGLDKNGKQLASEHRVLAELLRDAGYQTAAVVSSFVLDAKFGFDQGFDVYLDEFEVEGSKFHASEWEGKQLRGGFDARADVTTLRALEWLKWDRDPKRPFLLFVHYFDPHEPYAAPEPFGSLFDDPRPSERESPRQAQQPDEAEVRAYDGEIAFCDHHVGRLLAGLDAISPPERTLVIVTSDHGQGLMQHGDPYHAVSIYEEDVRVPLIFRWSGHIEAGRVVRAAVSLADLTPTVLGLAKVALPLERFEGRDLSEVLLAGAEPPLDRPIFLHRQRYDGEVVRGRTMQGEQFGVRLGGWKYIAGSLDESLELYDLRADPAERRNIHSERPEQARRLAEHVEGYRSRARPEGRERELSEADRAALEKLGYAQ